MRGHLDQAAALRNVEVQIDLSIALELKRARHDDPEMYFRECVSWEVQLDAGDILQGLTIDLDRRLAHPWVVADLDVAHAATCWLYSSRAFMTRVSATLK